MDNQNSPILDNNSLETTDEVVSLSGVVSAPSQGSGVVSAMSNSNKDSAANKGGLVKRVFNVINVYFLFLLIVLLALGGAAYYAYLQTRKQSKLANVTTQKLTQDSTQEQLSNLRAKLNSAQQRLARARAFFEQGAAKANIEGQAETSIVSKKNELKSNQSLLDTYNLREKE